MFLTVCGQLICFDCLNGSPIHTGAYMHTLKKKKKTGHTLVGFTMQKLEQSENERNILKRLQGV